MAFTRKTIEDEITKKTQPGKSRKEVIDKLMKGAKRGAFRAEKEVAIAQSALAAAQTPEEVDKLTKTIASEGRIASNENQRIAILKQIIEDDKKKI